MNTRGDLRITVGALLPSTYLWAPHSSSESQAVELLSDIAGPSQGGTSISFGAPAEDQMSIAASEGGLESSRDEDSALQPPLGE